MQIGKVSNPAWVAQIPSLAGRDVGEAAAPSSGAATDPPAIQGHSPVHSSPSVQHATDTESSQSIDFTNATRQELFDWMNGELRAGRMTLDESTSFLGMTVRIDVATGQPVDMATDTDRFNFIERLENGIDGALWRHDRDAAARLQTALKTALRYQKQYQQQSSGIDVIV